MDKTRFLSFRTDLGKLRDALVNASNGCEQVKSLFEELVKIYPELHLTEELLLDLVQSREKEHQHPAMLRV